MARACGASQLCGEVRITLFPLVCWEQDIPLKWDAVVVAAPLEQAKLEFAGFEPPRLPHRTYQRTVTTYVRGVLNASFFGEAELPRGGFCRVVFCGIHLPIPTPIPRRSGSPWWVALLISATLDNLSSLESFSVVTCEVQPCAECMLSAPQCL